MPVLVCGVKFGTLVAACVITVGMMLTTVIGSDVAISDDGMTVRVLVKPIAVLV